MNNKNRTPSAGEVTFVEMPESNYVRPAQIPVTKERLAFLINDGNPLVMDKWVIKKHDDHILIYDKQSGYCLFDAKLLMLNGSESDSDLVAVVSEIKINQDRNQRSDDMNEDDFSTVADLIIGNSREKTEQEDITISKVAPEAFLVKDPSLKDMEAPFLCWLRETGFKLAWHKGHYDVCDWVFVNITHKLFAYGMPGVEIVQAIGDHAITISEFFTIWNIYDKYEGLDLLAMNETEQKDRNSLVYYVRTASSESRLRLVDYIESEGFSCEVDEVTNRDIVLESRYPVVINAVGKVYSMLHNTTTAAAAVSSHMVINEADFYVLYKKENCSYEEYIEAVRDHFKGYNYSEDEITEFFNRPDIASVIKENYKNYINRNELGIGYPASVAGCLDLMYE